MVLCLGPQTYKCSLLLLEQFLGAGRLVDHTHHYVHPTAVPAGC